MTLSDILSLIELTYPDYNGTGYSNEKGEHISQHSDLAYYDFLSKLIDSIKAALV
jgi:hypothetical protein